MGAHDGIVGWTFGHRQFAAFCGGGYIGHGGRGHGAASATAVDDAGETLGEDFVELFDGEWFGELAAFGDPDVAGFFADDDDEGIALLAEAHGGTVATA